MHVVAVVAAAALDLQADIGWSLKQAEGSRQLSALSHGAPNSRPHEVIQSCPSSLHSCGDSKSAPQDLAASFKHGASYSLVSPGPKCLWNEGLCDPGSPQLLPFPPCTRPHSFTVTQKSTSLSQGTCCQDSPSSTLDCTATVHPLTRSLSYPHIQSQSLTPTSQVTGLRFSATPSVLAQCQ